MIEVIRKFLCHECGSNNDVQEVVYGKIKLDMCGECIEKKEDQREFKFSELSDKAKARAVLDTILHSYRHGETLSFDEAWKRNDRNTVTLFDADGECAE